MLKPQSSQPSTPPALLGDVLACLLCSRDSLALCTAETHGLQNNMIHIYTSGRLETSMSGGGRVGLRRRFKAPISSEARVRIPSSALLFLECSNLTLFALFTFLLRRACMLFFFAGSHRETERFFALNLITNLSVLSFLTLSGKFGKQSLSFRVGSTKLFPVTVLNHFAVKAFCTLRKN